MNIHIITLPEKPRTVAIKIVGGREYVVSRPGHLTGAEAEMYLDEYIKRSSRKGETS